MLKDTNPKDAVGVRKWRQYCTVPITIIWELGVAMLEGARKYGRHNYRVAGVRASVYVDAAKGHIDSWWEGEDIDSDSGLSHITKAMASLAVLRDAMLNDMMTDDRPPKVKNFDQFKADMQKAVEGIMERHPDACEPFTELGQQAVAASLRVVAGETLTPPRSDKPWEDLPVWNASDADFVDQDILSTPSYAEPAALTTVGHKPAEVRIGTRYTIAHRAFDVEFVHPDDPEFDRMHVWGGLTSKQLCRLVMEEAKEGQSCGMNHTSKTGNLTIYRPDQFDMLLRQVLDRISQQDSYECRLDWPDGGFRECSTRLTADDWFKACPGVRVTPRPKHSMMKPKGDVV